MGWTFEAARSVSAVTSERPMAFTLPAFTCLAIAPTVSSIGRVKSRRNEERLRALIEEDPSRSIRT